MNTWEKGDAWIDVHGRCESPIEQRMCVEISERLGYPAHVGSFLECDNLQELLADRGAVVFGQQWIGRYRADFLIAMYEPGWRIVSVAAIECDGHEFHSTQLQRLRDAERDRSLSGHGIKVIRFTGHEIVRRAKDVMGRIPHEMGAPAGSRLWGETQRELYLEEAAALGVTAREYTSEELSQARTELGMEE